MIGVGKSIKITEKYKRYISGYESINTIDFIENDKLAVNRQGDYLDFNKEKNF